MAVKKPSAPRLLPSLAQTRIRKRFTEHSHVDDAEIERLRAEDHVVIEVLGRVIILSIRLPNSGLEE